MVVECTLAAMTKSEEIAEKYIPEYHGGYDYKEARRLCQLAVDEALEWAAKKAERYIWADVVAYEIRQGESK